MIKLFLEKNLIIIIILCSIFGIIVSSTLLSGHIENEYFKAHPEELSMSLLFDKCDVSDTFSCLKVDDSPYSEIFNIPVSLMGIVGYAIIFLFSFIYLMYRKFRNIHIKKILLLLHIGALLFSFYLTFIEIFVIHSMCQYCLTSQGLILISSASMFILYRKYKD